MNIYYNEVCFRNKKILEPGSLDIGNNDIIVIKGPNGSGKSSLVKNALANEKNSGLDMIYINQSNNMFVSEMSLLENITMSVEKEYNNKIKDEIEDIGFGYLLKKDIKKLSGGEKRLITLLRGFFSKESILIIDEPTNDLDYKIVNKVIDILKELKHEKKLIIISHDSRMKELADIVYEIKDIVYWILHMKLQKNKIIVLKNYGYTKSEIAEKIVRIINNRYPKLLIWFLLIVYNVISFFELSFSQINFYWGLIFSLMLSVMYFMSNMVIHKYIDYYYRWYI